jgi:hypothetical protein
MQAMTLHQVMEAFASVNEQQTRVAWRMEAFRRTKEFPKSEDALMRNAARGQVQSPKLQKQIAKMITAHAKVVLEK